MTWRRGPLKRSPSRPVLGFGPALAPRILMLATLLSGRAASAEAQAQQDPLADLDQYAEAVRGLWQAPGLAVAIVKDDQVVVARGYGVRELGGNAPVDEGTVFAIASTTKAFTAAALAMLVDEGKVGWDDRVTDHLRSFQLHDPYITRELTIRDLLSHRGGLPRGDNLWYLSPFDRKEILRRVRYLEPAWSFRSRYGYQNVMFIAAGEIVEAVSGASWDEFLQERIFDPLGMLSTTTQALKASASAATPHGRIEGEIRPISWRDFRNVGGAGAINSSVADMAHWIRLQLGEGMYGGRQLLSDSVIKEMRTPQTVIRPDEDEERLFPESHLSAYGLGWTLQDYRGRLVMRHGGSLDGMRTHILLIPEEELGVVAITNVNESSVPKAMVWYVADQYLGPTGKEWHRLFRAADDEARRREEEERATEESQRLSDTRPSRPLRDYAGSYDDELYGTATIRAEDGSLKLQVGPHFVAQLEHWHLDTFRATWDDRYMGRDFVTFRVGRNGSVSSVEVEGFGEFRRRHSRPGS